MTSHAQLIKAVQLATRRLASSGNFDVLVRDVLVMCVDAVGAGGGTIYIHDVAQQRLRFEHVLPKSVLPLLPSRDIPDDFGLAGSAFQGRKTIVAEYPEKPESEWNQFEKATGTPIRSIIATPLVMEDEQPIGVVQLLNKVGGPFSDSDVAVMDTIAAVSTLAYYNYRLTEESSRASTLLGMGKVAHDIGNLAASLYANVNYADFALDAVKERIDEEDRRKLAPLFADLDPTIDELKESVDRIVGYSRLMSDMSAGRAVRPAKKLASLAETLTRSAAYLDGNARAVNVQLILEIDHEAPEFMHDELFVNRIVQNLVGNAIKAVLETRADESETDSEEPCGRVVLRYYSDGRSHVVEVADTGPGMSMATVNRILSGTARSSWDKASGSGWGTKIVLELALSHAGVVDIVSAEGSGTTFRVTFPASVGNA
jgi:K+-sensing histidine kinase KdpD